MKMLKKLFVISIVFSGFSQTLLAQDDKSFTLEEAKAYALEHHYNIINADNEVLIARQKVNETIGMGLPQVSFTGNFSNYLNLPVQVVDASFINPNAQPGETISFQAGTDYTVSGMLQVNQLVFNGSYLIGMQAAKYYANFQESVSQLTKEEVVFNAIQSYQLAAIAKENKAFADSIVVLTQKVVDQQSNYFELGLMLQEDMDQLLFSLLTAKDAAVTAQLQLDNAINLFKLSIGYPINEEVIIEESPEDLKDKSAIAKGDFHQNLQFEIASKQVVLSEYNLKNNRMANVPTLNAFFQHGYNAYTNEFNFHKDNWFDQTFWGLQLNVPIFSGYQRKNRIAQANVRLMKDQNKLDQLEQTLQFQEVQAQNNLLGAKNKHELQLENIKLARSIYNNTLTKEQIGKGNSINVTQKHNQLMMAQAQYLGSLVDLLQAQLALDKLYNNIISNEK